jgi:organic hydroperoxide reductase OsmC/OhrA
MIKEHKYSSITKWTGNKGTGTDNYMNYERSHEIIIKNKPILLGSSDPAFRGDATKHNPEDLLISSLSTCHMLWYLHLCADSGIIVVEYIDNVTGILIEPENKPGHFNEVTLNPIVTVQENSMLEKAIELHKKAHELCFIANSVNFPVKIIPIALYI